MLLKGGWDINPQWFWGSGNVTHRALEGHADECLISMLLEEGADVNANNPLETTLQTAIRHYRTSAARLLLEHGADIHAPSSRSTGTALHAAYEVNDIQTVRLLLEYGAGVNAVDAHGNSTLMATLL